MYVCVCVCVCVCVYIYIKSCSCYILSVNFICTEITQKIVRKDVVAWRIPGTGEPGGLLSMGSHRIGHD